MLSPAPAVPLEPPVPLLVVPSVSLIPQSDFTMADPRSPRQPLKELGPTLCCFRNLDNDRYIQRRAASGAALSGFYPREFSLKVDVGWNRVSANRTVGLSFRVIIYESFHVSSSLHRTRLGKHGLYQIRKDS